MVDRIQSEGRVDNIKAMILLDMIGDKDLVIAKESSSSSWLVEAIWSSARKAGYGQHFPSRDQYITDDHIPFLEAGIPAVDLIDFDYEDQGESFWHTKNDTLDKISANSLKIVGDVVLLSLDSIEALIKD
ncbi:MAG: M28 family peptidase [Acidobacteria bacterium]|nr:M28 family peptidase [Acidobacteriota bacterium]